MRMFVVRPKGILGTPKMVARSLGAKLRFYPNAKKHRVFDFKRDFFMGPVAPEHVKNAPEGYDTFDKFCHANKYIQRQMLREQGVPVPETAVTPEGTAFLKTDKFVVRPMRHSQGAGYRVTEDKLDFTAGQEYISELYPKKREYRVIFVFGKPLIWLRKKPNDGVDYTKPWGHENSYFQTIIDVAGCRLAGTDCVQRLAATSLVKASHIVAADILFNAKSEQPYVVLELNLCPSLQIDGNREKVVDEIRSRRQLVPRQVW